MLCVFEYIFISLFFLFVKMKEDFFFYINFKILGSFYCVNMYVNLYEYIEKEGKKFILENLKIDVIYKKNFKNMY